LWKGWAAARPAGALDANGKCNYGTAAFPIGPLKEAVRQSIRCGKLLWIGDELEGTINVA